MGRSPWNVGAWFGSQIGATLWLAVSACVLAYRGATPLAILILGLFLFANAVGAWLWRTRTGRTIGSGFGTLVIVFWASGLAAIFAIDRAGHWSSLAVPSGDNVSATSAAVMLTVISAALFFLLRRVGTAPTDER